MMPRSKSITVLPCQREWALRNLAPPAQETVKPVRPSSVPLVRTPVTELEARAIKALAGVTFCVATGTKRFARQIQGAKELTDRQRVFLWGVVYTFRRQIRDAELVKIATEKRT